MCRYKLRKAWLLIYIDPAIVFQHFLAIPREMSNSIAKVRKISTNPTSTRVLEIATNSLNSQQLSLNILFRLFRLRLVTDLAHFHHPRPRTNNILDRFLPLKIFPIKLHPINKIRSLAPPVRSTLTISNPLNSPISNPTGLLQQLRNMVQAIQLPHTININNLTFRPNSLDRPIRMLRSNSALPSQ
jgi:hypothetical protein